jgi:TetR/AcrR family transcriptional regulator
MRADHSREAILDAAERLFADEGFEAVSMARIGHAAGLSRGAPGYFFGSKEALHRAVLQRMFESAEALVEETRQKLAATPSTDLEDALEVVVDNLLDFLYARPHFLTLVERETLRRSGLMGGARAHLSLLRTALVAMADELDVESAEREQLLLSLLGLCWFPLANPRLIRDLGGDLDRSFVEARKRHIVALLRAGLRREVGTS